MNFQVQQVIEYFISGIRYEQVCALLQGKPGWTGYKAFKSILKATNFTEQNLKSLWSNIQSPIEILKCTSEIYKLFTISSKSVISQFVYDFIQKYPIQKEYLQYLDIIVKCPNQAYLIIQKLSWIDIMQMKLDSYGEISWLITQMNNQDVLQWICNAYQTNNIRAMNKALQYIKHQSRQIELLKNVQKQVLGTKEEVQRSVIGMHEKSVHSICVSKRNQFVISGSSDHTVRLWDLLDQQRQEIIGRHNGPVYSVCISSNDQFVVSASKAVKLWDLQDQQQNMTIGNHADWVKSVCISRSHQFVISAGKQIKLWNLQDVTKNRIIVQYKDDIQQVCLSRSDKFIVYGAKDKVWLLELANFSKSQIIGRHNHLVSSVCISKYDLFVVSGSADETVKLWDLQDNTKNKIIGNHNDYITQVCISQSNQFVLSVSRDNTTKLWDLNDKTRVRIIENRKKSLYSICISKNDQFIVEGEGSEINWPGEYSITLWIL